ncbi:hypothetical protein EAE96_009934 [Botrytis aclada]|nr:hypothetical protein EAE96_009934 [Botrytis aclada]
MANLDSKGVEIIGQPKSPISHDQLRKIEAWLEPTDYLNDSSEFNRHIASRAPGIGLWVCDTPQYQQWHNTDDHGSLWVKGVPGAGKSVISASLVQHLKTTENGPVLSFFFRQIFQSNRRSRNLVCDWLTQLLRHSVNLQVALNAILDMELEQFSDEQLWDYLLLGLSSIEKVYCVVDALDEMDIGEEKNFLKRLNSLATFRPQFVKTLMTSRPVQQLQLGLRDASIVHISLEDDLVGKDVDLFVSRRLESMFEGHSPDAQLSIHSIICNKSAGLFLYARLTLDQVMSALVSKNHLDLEGVDSSLPVGMQDMYNSILLQQSKSTGIDTYLQAFTLNTVLFSSRLLRLNELADLLAFVYPSYDLSSAKTIVKSACGPLLEIMNDEMVQVIHHSFTEFLLDSNRAQHNFSGSFPQFPVLDQNSAHKCLVLNCLAYMQSGTLTDAVSKSNDVSRVKCPRCDRGRDECCCDWSIATLYSISFRKAKLDHPFLDYTIRNWTYHGNHYDIEEKSVFDAVSSFLNPESMDFRRWLTLEWGIRFITTDSVVPSPAHVAAFSGMSSYLKLLLSKTEDINSKDTGGRTLLHWACRRGHLGIVELLLQHRAILDNEDGSHLRPIHEAARRNFASIVLALLKAGVNPTRSTDDNSRPDLEVCDRNRECEPGTALDYMCVNGHTETILVTVPFLETRGVEEALWRCLMNGKLEAVRAILTNTNVSLSSVYTGTTMLYAATMGGNPSCVEQVLIGNADPNAFSEPRLLDCRQNSVKPQDRKYFQSTALHVLAERWGDDNRTHANEQILNLLVKYGANLEAKDSNGRTPLWLCCTSRTNVAKSGIRCFLNAGSSATITDEKGHGLIYNVLARTKHVELIKLLIHHGADVSALSTDGESCLEALFVNRFTTGDTDTFDTTVQFLVKNGARCDVQLVKRLSIIERVVNSKNYSFETFKIMLQYCTDKETKSHCLFSVNKDTKEEMIRFIQELTSSGVSLEERDEKGCTALISNIQNSKLFQALRDCGARMDAVDDQGKGVWHHALSVYPSNENLNTIRSLIVKDGQDPRQVDNAGDTFLHEVARLYHGSPEEVGFTRELLTYGLSMDAKNMSGKTPLHTYIEDRNPRKVYRSKASHFGDASWTAVPFLELAVNYTKDLKIDSQDSEGLTALHAAALHSEVHVSSLLNAGADSTIMTNDGRNLLHLASRARRSDVVHLLIERCDRALVSQKDSCGRTPLHDACASGRMESVYLLLKAGADITSKDSQGRTPLHTCSEFVAEQNL